MPGCSLTTPDPKNPYAARGLTRRSVMALAALTAAGGATAVGTATAPTADAHGSGRITDDPATWQLDPDGRPDVPRGVDADIKPAAYTQNSDDPGDYGNYDLANRTSEDIDFIVIHDTEETYEGTIKIFQDPLSYTAAHYVVGSDGHITQMVDVRNACWHAGNWYVNGRSIGIEMVGYAEKKEGFTAEQYEAVGKLVRHLSDKYDVPLDREHIIGHNEVPAQAATGQAAMHWDPGPFYSFDALFAAAGAPFTERGRAEVESVLIRPDSETNLIDFTSTVAGAGQLGPIGAGSILLRTEPDDDAPLVADPTLHADGGSASMLANDWGAQATSGQVFSVTDTRGEWVQINHAGTTAWLKAVDEKGVPTVEPAGRRHRQWVRPKKRVGDAVCYGTAYPQAEAFEELGDEVKAIAELGYTIPRSGRYVYGGRYMGSCLVAVTYGQIGHWVEDETEWRLIRLGHRIGFVKADDVNKV